MNHRGMGPYVLLTVWPLNTFLAEAGFIISISERVRTESNDK
jgi:hypothetical protein